MEEDNDAIAQRLAAMERDVLKREAAAEEKRVALLKEMERHESEARLARNQFEQARRDSVGENKLADEHVRAWLTAESDAACRPFGQRARAQRSLSRQPLTPRVCAAAVRERSCTRAGNLGQRAGLAHEPIAG
jgi:hypothetical protein